MPDGRSDRRHHRGLPGVRRDPAGTSDGAGIDIAPYALSHLAYRLPDWDQYVHLRMLLERQATANLENVWNGRPISKILLAKPLEVLDGALVPMIELIPPVHQRVYRMGLEHLGVVVGDGVDEFSREHDRGDVRVKTRSVNPSGLISPV